jgi:hypothetical protein
MKRLNCEKMRFVLIGFVVTIVIGSSAKAEIIMSEPSNLGPVINGDSGVQESDFSHDGLELYFSASRPGGYGGKDIWLAKRETLNSPWQEPVNLGPAVNSSSGDMEPSISGDGLELYFGCWDDYILRVCTRTSKDAPWSSPVKIGPPVGSDVPAMEIGSNDAWTPEISGDGLFLYFSSTRVGGHGGIDIWMATRATKNDPWGEPVNLGPNVNTGADDWSPSISTDGLTIVFSRGTHNMWATTRKSTDDEWGPAMQLDFKNAPGRFHSPALSPDSSTLYFDATNEWGGYGGNDFWQVEFIPIVDFNSDGVVDIADLVILIEHWGEENLLYDIGPLPQGDGFVDEADLKVLMSHWDQEVYDPTLIANLRLDETEGEIAYNSVSDNHGVLSGNPTWQPDSGHAAGALQFDGIDDYINTDFVLNPGFTEFSVFAWIQGGSPGQVIISQKSGFGNVGATWLGMDASDGRLITELTSSAAGPLESETVITDGQWHHIGFVWDGSYRTLYVDGIAVTKDTVALTTLKSSTGGMYIGVGKDRASASFFSGLIDDVRIYNRVVSP